MKNASCKLASRPVRSGPRLNPLAYWRVNTKEMRSIQTAGLVRELAQITRVDSRAVAQLNAAINIRGPGSRVPEMKRHRVNCEIQSIHSSGDPDEQAHPVVNSAPQRRRSPVEGGSIHFIEVIGCERSPETAGRRSEDAIVSGMQCYA
jgi:hypothetical protein